MQTEATATPLPLANDLPEWTALQNHAQALHPTHMRALFTENPQRFAGFHLEYNGLIFDYSRQHVTEETLKLLLSLAKAREVKSRRDAMFAGDKINSTEDRAVLHTALRRPETDQLTVDGEDVMPFITDVKRRMRDFCAQVHSGARKGYSGKRLRHIVNIGIGGSDLGPLMVCEALKPLQKPDITVRFISNVDGSHLQLALQDLDPAETLFLIASKTFTTQETIANAHSARAWFLASGAGEEAVAKHFVALSTNEQAVQEFGIAPENMFPFRDWVGGRYSLWSAIGLSIALSVGYEYFEALLRGAHDMDRHFQKAPLEENMPVIAAMLGIWNRNFLTMPAVGVLPYDQLLHRFPAFLQQLDMESNGKRVSADGRDIPYQTGPVVFGEPGTNGQHAFYQLVHQGTERVSCEFIAARKPQYDLGEHHTLLLANMVAQAEALCHGRTLEEADRNPQKVFPGNVPSTVLLLPELSPFALGQMIALYEHKVFVQGVIWGINSFDQFGVELGKELANSLLSSWATPKTPGEHILSYLSK